MAIQKQICALAEAARKCLADLKAVQSGEFDMIRWMRYMSFESKITEVERALESYNTKLQEAENARKVFETKQLELEDIARQFLPEANAAQAATAEREQAKATLQKVK
jgi:hypothetical protein